ncbi:MAG: hypothetical protein R3E55_10360 [Burkholderiaceae bacterium]
MIALTLDGVGLVGRHGLGRELLWVHGALRYVHLGTGPAGW